MALCGRTRALVQNESGVLLLVLVLLGEMREGLRRRRLPLFLPSFVPSDSFWVRRHERLCPTKEQRSI